MDDNEKDLEEGVEAVPGPRIVISKETYEKMQENNNAEKNRERLYERKKKFFNFFKNINKKEQEEDLPFIARVNLKELQEEREASLANREVSILASADFTKRIPKIRLYYIAVERYKEYGSNRQMLGKTYGISSPFYLPTGMSIEDACKVVSYLSEKIEREHNLEPASNGSVAAVSRILDKYGFEKKEGCPHGYSHTTSRDTLDILRLRREWALPGNESIAGVTDLFTVGGDFDLFKRSDLYENYFDWFTEGVTEEEIYEIYRKIHKDYILEDLKESTAEKIKSHLNLVKNSKLVVSDMNDDNTIDEDELEIK